MLVIVNVFGVASFYSHLVGTVPLARFVGMLIFALGGDIAGLCLRFRVVLY